MRCTHPLTGRGETMKPLAAGGSVLGEGRGESGPRAARGEPKTWQFMEDSLGGQGQGGRGAGGLRPGEVGQGWRRPRSGGWGPAGVAHGSHMNCAASCRGGGAHRAAQHRQMRQSAPTGALRSTSTDAVSSAEPMTLSGWTLLGYLAHPERDVSISAQRSVPLKVAKTVRRDGCTPHRLYFL